MAGEVFEPSQAGYIGKCQSCRHARQKQHGGAAGGLLLFCYQIPFNEEQTRPHWRCEFYDYEPGSLG